jgi:hypothetical protein
MVLGYPSNTLPLGGTGSSGHELAKIATHASVMVGSGARNAMTAGHAQQVITLRLIPL